ncbi:proteoglycan 4-like [Bacillus rossius redtenbacheri]|uniref:proteoglycan 4-like n=1 Tax=Bacillus rossius redtenbacheri TaxID=93214 RepID=UPI002FDCDE38
MRQGARKSRRGASESPLQVDWHIAVFLAAVTVTLCAASLVFLVVKAIQWLGALRTGAGVHLLPVDEDDDEEEEICEPVQAQYSARENMELRRPGSRTKENVRLRESPYVQKYSRSPMRIQEVRDVGTYAAKSREESYIKKQDKFDKQTPRRPEIYTPKMPMVSETVDTYAATSKEDTYKRQDKFDKQTPRRPETYSLKMPMVSEAVDTYAPRSKEEPYKRPDKFDKQTTSWPETYTLKMPMRTEEVRDVDTYAVSSRDETYIKRPDKFDKQTPRRPETYSLKMPMVSEVVETYAPRSKEETYKRPDKFDKQTPSRPETYTLKMPMRTEEVRDVDKYAVSSRDETYIKRPDNFDKQTPKKPEIYTHKKPLGIGQGRDVETYAAKSKEETCIPREDKYGKPVPDKPVKQTPKKPEVQADEKAEEPRPSIYTTDVKGSRLKVLSMPLDGNSLYAALAHQIYGVLPGQPKMKEFIRTMRIDASSELKKFRRKYWEDLLSDIDNHKIRYSRERADDGKVRLYLNDQERDGFPAGFAAMQALANVRGFHIQFHAAGYGSATIKSARPGPDPGTWLLHMQGFRDPDGDEELHFDSVLEVSPIEGYRSSSESDGDDAC